MTVTAETTDVADRALRYADLRRFADAERILREALRSEPEDEALVYALAHVLHRRERHAEALEATGSGLRRHPDSTDLWHQRALALEELGRRAEAIEAVERGLAVDSREHRLLWDYGVLLGRDGRGERAVAVYRRALELYPGDAILLGLLASSLFDIEEYGEGFAVAAAALAAEPAQPDVLMAVGDARLALNHARSSLHHYVAAVRQAPGNDKHGAAVRYLLSWPIGFAYYSLIWTFTGLSLLAVPAGPFGPAGWLQWTVTAGTVAALAYSSHWFFRGGTVAWRGFARTSGAMIGAITTGVALGYGTAAAILLAVWLPSLTAAGLGLAGAVLMALTRAVEWNLDPEEESDASVYRRTSSNLLASLEQDLGFVRQLRNRWRLRGAGHVIDVLSVLLSVTPSAGVRTRRHTFVVDYAQLTSLNTSKLTSAAQASADFGKAMTDHGESVRTSAEIPPGMWLGGDANAAGALLAGLPEPLYGLSDSANNGKKTLDDLVTGLDKARQHLQGAHDAIKGTGITIDAKGVVTTPVVDDPQLAAENDRKAQDARDIIDEALKMANDADTKATDDLNSLAGAAQASYMEIPGKKEDLNRATDLLNTPENKITPQTAQELNDILKRNDNPEFNRQLMERLGPKGLLEKSANFSETGADLAENGDTAGADKFKETQRLLGESLASASQNGGLTPEWTQGLMDEGAKRLPGSNNIGYEALAPLLEHGKYDPGFLVPVAEHITRLDHGSGLGNESSAPGAGVSGIDSNPYVIDGQPGHSSPVSNPLNSVMTALDNSPEAAADYFTGTNEEQGLRYTDATGRPLAPTGDAAANPNIDYALDRAAGTEPGDPLDVNRVGDALEAAATGVPSDTAPEVPRPARTEEMANIAEHLTHRFGGNGDGDQDIIPGGKLEGMADNLTDIATTYMPEIHNSFLNPLSADALLPTNGATAEFNENDSAGLLHALGRHEDSFEQLLGASDEVRDIMLATEYQQNGPEGSWVQEALVPGSTVANILTDAQVEAGVHDAAESDGAANDGTQLGISGGKIAASAIPFGPAGATISELLDAVKEDVQVDTTRQAVYDGNVERTDVRDAHLERSKTVIEQLAWQDGRLDPAEETLLKNVDAGINNAWTTSQDEVEASKSDGLGAPGGK